MFSGEESVRIESNHTREELEDVVAGALDRLGAVRFHGSNRFRINGQRFNTSWAIVNFEGELRKGRRDGKWHLSLMYKVDPTPLCWVVAILGFLFFVVGILILLAPNDTKNRVQRAARNALLDARDDIEGDDEREGD